MRALILLLLASSALAQTDTSVSTMFTCVDRDGVKRLRNYPCGGSERDVDQLRLRTTTTYFANGRAVTPNSSPTSLTKEERFDAAQARSKARSERDAAACGPRPVQQHSTPAGSKTSDIVKAHSADVKAYMAADTAYTLCVIRNAH